MSYNIISLDPKHISNILALCPICYDIQNKILIFYICMRETPLKTLIANMKKYHIKELYPKRTLTSYCMDLSLFNYLSWGYPDYTEDPEPIYLPEYLYDLIISYDLYYNNEEDDDYNHEDDDYINEKMAELKAVTKIRLNRMIEEGKPYNI